MHSTQLQHVHMQYKNAERNALCAGTIQGDEQQHQAAARTAKQLTGVAIEASSIKPLHGASTALQAHTCKQEMKSTASGLDLLKVFKAVAGMLSHPANP